MQCLNETQKYLRKVVHEIGLELRSTAVCKGVRRTREGPFTLQDALTRHQWTATDVKQAIRQYHSSKKRKKNLHRQAKDQPSQPQEESTATTSQQSETCNEAAAPGRSAWPVAVSETENIQVDKNYEVILFKASAFSPWAAHTEPQHIEAFVWKKNINTF